MQISETFKAMTRPLDRHQEKRMQNGSSFQLPTRCFSIFDGQLPKGLGELESPKIIAAISGP
jgi:hypothetical protein